MIPKTNKAGLLLVAGLALTACSMPAIIPMSVSLTFTSSDIDKGACEGAKITSDTVVSVTSDGTLMAQAMVGEGLSADGVQCRVNLVIPLADRDSYQLEIHGTSVLVSRGEAKAGVSYYLSDS